ncbi:MAG: D-alanyl-D-alanine carboxypeptidase family protein [Alphaproteobacteria bacterium]
MKKILILIVSSIFIFNRALALNTTASQAIIYDYEAKTVIFEKNSKELVSPSSMSKIMTIYYLFKKLKDGEIKLTDEFKVSKKAWKKGGSKMFVNVGESVKVEDLIRGIIVQSGNDACIVVAEAISGSEELFAEELNLLGQEIGLKKSNFTNSTGWPDAEHLMTAEDLLTLTIRTIEDFPEYYHYYAEKEFTYSNIKQNNRNPLLYSNIESDGLKTGHTSLGGYGIVVSIKQNNRRLILVLNGLKSSKERAKESERLSKIAINQYFNYLISEEGKIIKNLNVWGGKKKYIGAIPNKKIMVTIPKKVKNNLKMVVKYKLPLRAPIYKDKPIAELIIKKDNSNTVLSRFNLYPEEDVEKASFFSKIYYNFKYLIFGDSIFSEQ